MMQKRKINQPDGIGFVCDDEMLVIRVESYQEGIAGHMQTCNGPIPATTMRNIGLGSHLLHDLIIALMPPNLIVVLNATRLIRLRLLK
jgi:hypothetical protein